MTTPLMYVPLPATIETQFRDTFRKELETMSLEEIVEACVNLVVGWEQQTTPHTRRLARYLSIIHSKEELTAVMRRHIQTILGTSGAASTEASQERIEGQQAEVVVPLVVLGVAIAIWLIGWAITGECDWYMGAYSP